MFLSLASDTCAASRPATSRTISGPALTSRSTRMHPTDGRSSHRGSARSSRFPKSVACITATSAGRRSINTAPDRSSPAQLRTTRAPLPGHGLSSRTLSSRPKPAAKGRPRSSLLPISRCVGPVRRARMSVERAGHGSGEGHRRRRFSARRASRPTSPALGTPRRATLPPPSPPLVSETALGALSPPHARRRR